MFKKLSLLIIVLTMGGCSYFEDSAIQDVKFETPGAYDAVCYAYIEKYKYVVRPPHIINLYKSDKDMKVDCIAPGNRRQVVYIEPEIEDSASHNILNGGVGLAWDYASKAMYKWPDTVVVSFVDVPIKEEELPTHNNPDIRQPETYKLEEFLPGRMRLNSDVDDGPTPLVRRGEAWYDEGQSNSETSAFNEPAVMPADKGDLQQVIENLNTAPAGQAEQNPVSLYPGQ